MWVSCLGQCNCWKEIDDRVAFHYIDSYGIPHVWFSFQPITIINLFLPVSPFDVIDSFVFRSVLEVTRHDPS